MALLRDLEGRPALAALDLSPAPAMVFRGPAPEVGNIAPPAAISSTPMPRSRAKGSALLMILGALTGPVPSYAEPVDSDPQQPLDASTDVAEKVDNLYLRAAGLGDQGRLRGDALTGDDAVRPRTLWRLRPRSWCGRTASKTTYVRSCCALVLVLIAGATLYCLRPWQQNSCEQVKTGEIVGITDGQDCSLAAPGRDEELRALEKIVDEQNRRLDPDLPYRSVVFFAPLSAHRQPSPQRPPDLARSDRRAELVEHAEEAGRPAEPDADSSCSSPTLASVSRTGREGRTVPMIRTSRQDHQPRGRRPDRGRRRYHPEPQGIPRRGQGTGRRGHPGDSQFRRRKRHGRGPQVHTTTFRSLRRTAGSRRSWSSSPGTPTRSGSPPTPRRTPTATARPLSSTTPRTTLQCRPHGEIHRTVQPGRGRTHRLRRDDPRQQPGNVAARICLAAEKPKGLLIYAGRSALIPNLFAALEVSSECKAGGIIPPLNILSETMPKNFIEEPHVLKRDYPFVKLFYTGLRDLKTTPLPPPPKKFIENFSEFSRV